MASVTEQQTQRSDSAEERTSAAGAGGETTRQARDMLGDIGDRAREMLRNRVDEQVSAGSRFVGAVARSIRAAADEFEDTSPQVADLVRSGAQRIDDFSHDLDDRSLEEMLEVSSSFARRNPALVFGAAFAVSLVAARLLVGTSDALGHAASRASRRAREPLQRRFSEDLGAHRRGKRNDT